MMNKHLFKGLITATLILGTAILSSAQTPVARHGNLTTSGAYLLNKNGNIVQLRGMSFYWSRTDWPGYTYYNTSTVDFLVDSWKCSVVRVAYANGSGWDGVKTVIERAISKGIYVIIDWHSHNAHNEEQQAIAFFKEQAQKYKNTPNVIFEVYNEPITAGGATTGTIEDAAKTWGAIKSYLKNVTQAIRNEGANNLIILGTPYYCQFVGIAASDQIKDNSGNPYKNVAYAFHFYAASHGPNAYYVINGDDGGVGMESTYLGNGLGRVPIFVSEWGTSHSNGGQEGKNQLDRTNTNWWFDKYINGKYKLSWCNWSVSSHERSSCFSGGTNPSESGQIVKDLLAAQSTDEYEPEWKSGIEGPAKDASFNMPGTRAARQFNRYYGSVQQAKVSFVDRDQIDVRTANDSCLKVNTSGDDNWVSYKFNLSVATSKIVIRTLAKAGDGNIEVYVDNTKAGEISVQKSTTWTSIVTNINVPAGQHTVKLRFVNTTGSGYMIEWIELTNVITAIDNALPQYRINNADPEIVVNKRGFRIDFPHSHGFTAYSIIGANGRVIRSGSINQGKSELNISGLPGGMWLIRLDNLNGAKLFKTVVSGK